MLEQLSLTLDGDEQVASISITMAFVLAVVSLAMFISYVDHIVHQARVSSILDRIGNETRFVLEREYAGDGRGAVMAPDAPVLPDTTPDTTVTSPTHASVIEIDVERTIAQDVAFGLRLLVDIAERSFSPGINDPTTAVQALDQLHDLLRRLGERDFGWGWHADAAGVARLYVRQPSWDTYVALALTRSASAASTRSRWSDAWAASSQTSTGAVRGPPVTTTAAPRGGRRCTAVEVRRRRRSARHPGHRRRRGRTRPDHHRDAAAR